jgi:hypothetical protein
MSKKRASRKKFSNKVAHALALMNCTVTSRRRCHSIVRALYDYPEGLRYGALYNICKPISKGGQDTLYYLVCGLVRLRVLSYTAADRIFRLTPETWLDLAAAHVDKEQRGGNN